MLRFLILLLCAFSAQIITAPSLSAQGARGIVVSPQRVVFEKGQRIIEVLIANRGEKTEKYRISLVNRAMLENGQLESTENPAENEHFASLILRYSPRQIILEPKQTQKIRIMSRLKSDSADGEYRSHLLVQEIPKAKAAQNTGGDENNGGLGINVQAVFGITIPIILRKGDLSAEVTLSTPKIVKIGDSTFLELAINRSGTKSIVGTLNVFTDSQKIGILKNVAVYMSTSRRIISVRLDPKRAENLSGKKIRITYGAEGQNEDAPKAELTFTVP